MQSLELRVQGSVRTDEVRRLLYQRDSGIRLSPSGMGSRSDEPRYSVVGDVLTYGGFLVNTAQLAVTIFQIYQAQRAAAAGPSGPKPIQIQIVTAKGTLNVPAATVAEIEQTIAQHVVDTE